jgi:hypothetical protein
LKIILYYFRNLANIQKNENIVTEYSPFFVFLKKILILKNKTILVPVPLWRTGLYSSDPVLCSQNWNGPLWQSGPRASSARERRSTEEGDAEEISFPAKETSRTTAVAGLCGTQQQGRDHRSLPRWLASREKGREERG